MEIVIEADELEEILGRAAPADLNLEPAMAAIAEMLVLRVHEEYETEGHGEWQELSESTLARRGADAEMLRDTDRWYASNAPTHGDDWAEVGSDVDYAIYHVSSAPRHLIPMRNPYVFREDTLDEIAELIAE